MLPYSQNVPCRKVPDTDFVRIEIDQLDATAERQQGIAALYVAVDESVEVHMHDRCH